MILQNQRLAIISEQEPFGNGGSRTKAASRGVKSGNLHVIRNTEMPAILIEGGFLTHPQEHARLTDPKYIEEMGHAIAEGVDKYFRTK
ncbi:MAG: N-acetylmuramoyl-L-alanine amidase [Simkania negevensis]|nr:N-acetylmuramoyl-L-alanine amidase [Simkania negevensis]